MGLDFIRRTAKTFTKSWDRNKTELAQPTLFTRYPECRSRSLVADIADGAAVLSQGARILVSTRGTELVLITGTTQIGAVQNPPSDLFAAVRQAGGNALGRVTRINPISGTADVEIE